MRPFRLTWLAGTLAALLLSGPAGAASPSCPAGPDFASIYEASGPFEAAIRKAETFEPSTTRLSGITVPHHLSADHLISLGFRAASAHRYKRIILLSPDHFFVSARPFATTTRGFRTVFGSVPAAAAAARTLLASGLVEESCLFAREHGVQALLPFLSHYFPDTPVLAVAISIRSRRTDWDAMAAMLQPLVDADTLVVQSTDFSHYLPHHQARHHDQQALNVLAAGSPDQIAALRQPDHVDSAGALYIQARLQRHAGAEPIVIASENLQEYGEAEVRHTTSYVVALWGTFGPDFNNPATGREKIYYLAGDTMFGRAMTPLLREEAAAERIAEEVLRRTKGRPLVVNLEGVVLPDVPAGIGHLTLVMPEQLTVDWLRRLNVAGVGLANNHAFDLGPSGLAETRAALEGAGLTVFGQGEALELPGVDVVALSDLGTNGTDEVDLLTPDLIDRLVRPDGLRPVVAYVHWGAEYVSAPGAREIALAEQMRLRGATVIAGAHPHVAGGRLAAAAGGDTIEAYSLGNFLFDQTAARSSGALLELRVFQQGTAFARLIPLPNLFDLGMAARRR